MAKKVKLLSICKPKQYKTISKNELVEDGKYLVYGANGVIGKSNKYTHENPTLMVTCRGATCGSLNISKAFSYINGNAMAFDSIDKNFDLMYLYYYLSSRGFNDAISGTAQPQITRENLKNIDVLELSLEKQKQIAKTLDKAQELIDLRKESIAKLDELAKSIFIDMFEDYLIDENPTNMLNFEEFAIIDTNMTTNFEEFAELPHIGIASIERDTGNILNFKLVKEENLESGKYLFNEKHILYSKIRPNLNKVALPSFSGLLSADAYPILAKDNVNRIFLAFLLRSNYFLNYILSHSDRANIPKVNKKQLSGFYCNIPDLGLQNKFAKIIEKIEEQKSLYEKELEKLEENFQALLQQSFKE
jgi:type I restriction enzyme S subunit